MRAPARAQLFDHLVAVHLRQHDVEHDQVGRLVEAFCRPACAVLGLEHLEALEAQAHREAGEDREIVFDDQYRRLLLVFGQSHGVARPAGECETYCLSDVLSTVTALRAPDDALGDRQAQARALGVTGQQRCRPGRTDRRPA
jgi:hypothetical protein